MREKTLVSFSTHNAPAFLQHFVESIEAHDAGHPFDLLIYDCEGTDAASERLLNRFSAAHMVHRRPNVGRAQGGYQAAFKRFPDYAHYLFAHDDSVVMRDGWLKAGIDRINDSSLEPCLQQQWAHLERMPVGKVGYNSYEWGTLDRYLRTSYPAIFRFMRPLLEETTLVGIGKESVDALLFQHIADDRTLYTNQCLHAIERIHNIEFYRARDGKPTHPAIDRYFSANYPGRGFIEPKSVYSGADWEGYQSVCEFFNDIMPMRHGFRTHNVMNDGYCQEDLGYNSFWGNEMIAHWGDHNVFKRLAIIEGQEENCIRQSYKDLDTLRHYTSLIKND